MDRHESASTSSLGSAQTQTHGKHASWVTRFGKTRIDGTGVQLAHLAILFLGFAFVTEWCRGSDGALATITPRVLRAQAAAVHGTNLTSPSGVVLRTYMDHEVVRLEAEVCGSVSLMALTVFAVCASIGLNDIAWTSSDSRRRVSSTVMYITIVACYTHYLMVQGNDLLLNSIEGSYYSLLRYLEWMFTTPVLLILVFQLHGLVCTPNQARYRREMWGIVVADEVMLVTGMLVNDTEGTARMMLLGASFACFFTIIGTCIGLFREILDSELTRGDRARFVILAIAKTICWTSFPVVFVAKELEFIDASVEHEFFLSCDVITKAAYCLLLSAGNIRVLDVHREEEVADIERLTKMQRDFFYNITHELRMPLNSVIGFNTLAVESGELTDVTDGFIKNSITSAEALLGLINQVLDYAKFNRKGAEVQGGHGLELSADEFSLQELIDQTLSISQRQDYTGEVFIRVDPSLFPMSYTSDFFRLRQCLVNLVNNAVKFSSNLDRKGCVLIDVRGYLEDDNARLTFCVEDNGVGIPEDKQSALFVPFSQQSDYSAMRVQGTGLGLTITKTIVELMGGSIDFTSKEDAGAKFSITLPVAYKPSSHYSTLPSDLQVVLSLPLGLQKRTVRNILACNQIVSSNIFELELRNDDHSQLQHYVKHADASRKVMVLIIEDDQYFAHEQFLRTMSPEPFILILAKSSVMKDLPNTQSTRAIMKPVAMSAFYDNLMFLARNSRRRFFPDTFGAEHDDESYMNTSDLPSKCGTDIAGGGGVEKGEEVISSAREWDRATPKSAAAEPQVDVSSMRVLVVEDNRLNQKVAVHSLKKCGCTVDLAENGLIATQLIEQTISGSLLPYDIIFMDVMMPVMDGTTATRRIRELERSAPPSYKRNLVIALSANVGPEHIMSVKDAGCDGSLGKPFYPSTLRKVLYDVFANEYVGFDGGSKTPSIGTRPGM